MTENTPTLATLTVAFASALLTWAATAIDAPAEVEATGLALLLALVALAAGRITQRLGTVPRSVVDDEAYQRAVEEIHTRHEGG